MKWGKTPKNRGIQNHYARVCLCHNNKSKVNNIHLIAHVKYDTIYDAYIPSSKSVELQATVIAKTPNSGSNQQATV